MTASVAVIYQPTKLRDDDITHEVIRGLASEKVDVVTYSVETAQSHLAELDRFDGMVFGSLCANNVNLRNLDTFFQLTKERNQIGVWRNKIATGFTHTLQLCAESLPLMLQLSLFCAQHNMIWIDEAPNTSPDNQGPHILPERSSGFAYGQRVAQITKRWSAS